jgi:hypothetical protein
MEMTEKAPDYLPAWRLLAQLAANEQKPHEALALLANIFPVEPMNFEARILQVQLWLAEGEDQESVWPLSLR